MRYVALLIVSFISGANFWTLKTKNGKSAVDSWHYWVNLLCLIGIITACFFLEG